MEWPLDCPAGGGIGASTAIFILPFHGPSIVICTECFTYYLFMILVTPTWTKVAMTILIFPRSLIKLYFLAKSRLGCLFTKIIFPQKIYWSLPYWLEIEFNIQDISNFHIKQYGWIWIQLYAPKPWASVCMAIGSTSAATSATRGQCSMMMRLKNNETTTCTLSGIWGREVSWICTLCKEECTNTLLSGEHLCQLK